MNLLAAVLSGKPQGSTTSSVVMLVMYIVIFVGIFYFLMIRPQKKQKNKTEEMHKAMEPVTIS